MARGFPSPKTALLALALLSVGACASSSPPAAAAPRSPKPGTPFGEGVVTLGMCPDEAIQAAGNPGPYVVKADPKWPRGTFPPVVVAAQCEHPDDSVIDLLFRNRSQFHTEEPVVFRVKFVKGRAVSIDRVPAGN